MLSFEKIKDRLLTVQLFNADINKRREYKKKKKFSKELISREIDILKWFKIKQTDVLY